MFKFQFTYNFERNFFLLNIISGWTRKVLISLVKSPKYGSYQDKTENVGIIRTWFVIISLITLLSQ